MQLIPTLVPAVDHSSGETLTCLTPAPERFANVDRVLASHQALITWGLACHVPARLPWMERGDLQLLLMSQGQR